MQYRLRKIHIIYTKMTLLLKIYRCSPKQNFISSLHVGALVGGFHLSLKAESGPA